MDYIFRELTIQVLDKVISSYIDYYNNDGGKWTYSSAKKRLEQIFLTPYFYGIGLWNDSELSGFAIGYFKQYDDILLYYLDEILIFKKHQNQGLGSKLLKELEILVKEQGAQKIDLSTTHEENHQKFYSRLGFKKSKFLVPMYKKI